MAAVTSQQNALAVAGLATIEGKCEVAARSTERVDLVSDQRRITSERRAFMTAVGISVVALVASPAHAARRKPPADEPKKKERDSPELSRYQQKLLEAAKRKEAFAEKVKERKAMADNDED